MTSQNWLPSTLAALALVALAATGCEREAVAGIPGARLGMSPRDVRDRFGPGSAGTWQTRAAGDDTVLEWRADAKTAAPVRFERAVFEFHLGMLVAIRADTTERASEEAVDVTPKTVTARKPSPNGSEVVVLARDCPTHRDEATLLAARAKR